MLNNPAVIRLFRAPAIRECHREVELALNTLRGVPLERRWGGGAYIDAHRITAAACPREDSTRACPACDPSRLPPF